MAEQKSVIFELSESLEYTNTKKGIKEETAQIEMYAPSYSTSKFTYKLAQSFMKAVFQASNIMKDDGDKSKKEEEMDAEAVKVIFLASEVSFEKVIDSFIFAANKVCFLDDDKKVPLTSHVISKMEFNDITKMVCFYIANFIVPFALSMK